MKRFTRTIVAAASMAALLAGEAHAQRVRDSARAQAFAAALEMTNRTSVQQQGSNNAAAIIQNGQGNTAGIRQFGRNNTGAITQNGDNNAACLIQVGRNLDGAITQTGDYNNAGVVQTRRGTAEVPVELCSSRHSSPRGVLMGVARHAVQRANR